MDCFRVAVIHPVGTLGNTKRGGSDFAESLSARLVCLNLRGLGYQPCLRRLPQLVRLFRRRTALRL